MAMDHAALLGKIVCDSRKAQKIRQDDAAGSIGVSDNFLYTLPDSKGER